jgi:uncharacterized membrane protein
MTDEFEYKDDFPEDEMPEKEPMPEMDDPSSFKAFTDDADMDVTDDDKLWALLAYVLTPLIPIIILLMEDKKERPFLRAHNAQALAWGVINVVIGVVVGWFLCGIPSLILWLVGCYWGWQAYQGQFVEIPVLTDFVKNQGWA